MTAFKVIEMGLATFAFLQGWFEGSGFEKARAELEARTDFFATLLSCFVCLSFWVGTFVYVLLYIPGGNTALDILSAIGLAQVIKLWVSRT